MLKIKKLDLEWASSKGLLKKEQVDPLYNALEQRPGVKSAFDLVHIIYYFGALLIIFGMGWFLNEAWDTAGGKALFFLGLIYVIIFTLASYVTWFKKDLKIAGGLLATIAVCMVPIMTYGFLKMTGWWYPMDNTKPPTDGRYRDYRILVKTSYLYLEIATILAGVIFLRFIKFPFLTAPIFFSLWYMSMDLTPLLFGQLDYTWQERKIVSAVFGFIILVVSYFVDRRTKEDYAFWGYLFGMMAFWGGLTLLESTSELNKFIYFCLNLFFIGLSVLFDRKIFIICGALGSLGYLGHLANKVFKDYLSFPIIVTMIGLIIIFLGVKYQKNKARVDKLVMGMIPKFIQDLSPIKRV
jgi:hypothetical protein